MTERIVSARSRDEDLLLDRSLRPRCHRRHGLGRLACS